MGLYSRLDDPAPIDADADADAEASATIALAASISSLIDSIKHGWLGGCEKPSR